MECLYKNAKRCFVTITQHCWLILGQKIVLFKSSFRTVATYKNIWFLHWLYPVSGWTLNWAENFWNVYILSRCHGNVFRINEAITWKIHDICIIFFITIFLGRILTPSHFFNSLTSIPSTIPYKAISLPYMVSRWIIHETMKLQN